MLTHALHHAPTTLIDLMLQCCTIKARFCSSSTSKCSAAFMCCILVHWSALSLLAGVLTIHHNLACAARHVLCQGANSVSDIATSCCSVEYRNVQYCIGNRQLQLCYAGVAVRSGHHCTQPLHRALGIPASARASPYLYNTHAEIDDFIEALQSSIKFFTDLA